LRRWVLTRPKGSLLPGEAELALTFGATRNTVREALNLLRVEGLIERHQGAGTFVVARTARSGFDRLQHFEDGLVGGANRVQNTVLACTMLPALAVVAEVLDVPVGEPVLLLERVVLIDGEPAMLSTGYLPGDVATALEPHPLDGQVYRLFETLGYDLEGADMDIGAVLADAATAPVLDVAVGAPLLRLERIIRLGSGRAIEYGVSLLRGDRMTMVRSLPRHPAERSG
jgi:GntR family transcriptional regulator